MTEDDPPTTTSTTGSPYRRAWEEYWQTPWALRAFLCATVLAALVLPLALRHHLPAPAHDAWLTVLLLVLVSALNVELGRMLAGGIAATHQPHKALSAWALASALLLPLPWLLVIVPVTYVHARARGIRVRLWNWVGSASFVILAGVAAGVVRSLVLGEEANLMAGNGGRGMLTVLAAGAAFLLVESVLFWGPALLNRPEEEEWLRRTLRSRSYYGTEGAVLLIGGLLSAVWTGGAWFVLSFLPIYALAQRAALHEPLRERADTAAELASKNLELESANQFKIDLMGMLGHEIGNPLTAIAGYAQIGSEALQPDGSGNGADHPFDVASARSSLEVVERNAAQIRTVLHEVLSMVSSERGALTARRQHCRVEDHCHNAVAAQPAARRATVECEPGLAALVQPGHLDQILANLLSNADKYAGGATLVCAMTDPSGQVEISVVDAGPGIPADFREDLFQRFSRSASTAAHVTGTGLGLFISRELARANGGDLHHRDAEPTGSRFVVTLPSATVDA